MDVLIEILVGMLIFIVLVFAGYASYLAYSFRSLFRSRRDEYIQEGHDDDN